MIEYKPKITKKQKKHFAEDIVARYKKDLAEVQELRKRIKSFNNEPDLVKIGLLSKDKNLHTFVNDDVHNYKHNKPYQEIMKKINSKQKEIEALSKQENFFYKNNKEITDGPANKFKVEENFAEAVEMGEYIPNLMIDKDDDRLSEQNREMKRTKVILDKNGIRQEPEIIEKPFEKKQDLKKAKEKEHNKEIQIKSDLDTLHIEDMSSEQIKKEKVKFLIEDDIKYKTYNQYNLIKNIDLSKLLSE